MRKILFLILMLLYNSLHAYNEDEIIYVATYELAADFFLSMKDEKLLRKCF